MISERETNPDTECGYGYLDTCCCICALQFKLRSQCECTGGQRKHANFPNGPLGDIARAVNEAEEAEQDEKDGYCCLAFISDDIAQAKSSKHGACEGFVRKTKYQLKIVELSNESSLPILP